VNRKKVAIVASALLIAFPLAARAETAREMLDKAKTVNHARKPKDVSQRAKMTLVNAREGDRARELKMYSKTYPDDTGKAITFFLSPSEVKGVAFLVWAYPDRDDDQWIYLPEFRRSRRITTNTRRQSFQGSDFSYQDLELLNEIADWSEADATSKVLKDSDTIDGVPCTAIELLPQHKDLEYGRLVIWLDRADSTIRKMDLYQTTDAGPAKSLTLGDFHTIDGVPTPQRIEMQNLAKCSKTIMELSEIRYNAGLDDEIFTERYLARGSAD